MTQLYDTNLVPYGKYRPHGRIHFNQISSQIICYTITGSLNKELVDSLAEIESDLLNDVQKNQENGLN